MSNKNNNLQQQEKLIAVLLLESYSESLKPLNSKRAECLLPIFGQKTLLDNNIEYLIENNFEEIYLFCTNHHQQIKAHIDERKWRNRVEIHFLYNFKCQSIGDAMREIDGKNLISSSFVLITANAVLGNIKLTDYFDVHKQVSKLDKNAVMTMLCQKRLTDLSYEFNQNDASSSMNQSNTLIIHNNSNRILFYNKVNSNEKNKYLKLPTEMFTNAYHASKQLTGYIPKTDTSSQNATKTTDSIQHLKQIQHRNDLIETQVYLCSPYVLHMFTDNFDYETMSDFIHGILIEEEVAGYTLYIDVVSKKPGDYLAIINNLNSYYFQTLNLIKRTELILSATEKANYNRVVDKCNSYVSRKSVRLGKNVKIERNVLVEANCKIGDNCELINCLISSNCVIGSNVKLSNCILWPNSHVGNSSVLNACFLGYNVKIGSNCNLCENCLFSNDCHVKDNTSLTKRGVYVPIKIIKDQSQENELSVYEDNYTKYYLNSEVVDDDDDDEFETDEDMVQTTHDTESLASADDRNQNDDPLNDTGKNNHFFVWKSGSKSGQIKNKLLREQNDDEIEQDLNEQGSVYSDTSSDQSDFGLTDDDDETDYEAEENPTLKPAVSTESLRSSHLNEEDAEIFVKEATEIVKRGFVQNLNVDNVILEINSCKHAHNIQIEDLNYYLVRVILDMPFILNKSNQFDYLTIIKGQFEKEFGKLCENYYTKNKKSQRIFLDALLDYFVEAKPINNVNLLDTVYLKLINYLYNDDNIGFLSEELILEWYDAKMEEKKLNEKHKVGLKKLEKFIEWLKEDDDDDDDDNDEDEEDDEDED